MEREINSYETITYEEFVEALTGMDFKTFNEKYNKKEDIQGQLLPTYELRLNIVSLDEKAILESIENAIKEILNNPSIIEAYPKSLGYLGFIEALGSELKIKSNTPTPNNE